MEKLEKLYLETLKNKGITLNSELEVVKDLKFIVSLQESELIVNLDELNYQYFKRVILEYWKICNNALIGVWIDNGLVYFDISESYDVKEIALIVAVQRKQLAIYDAINDQTIEINYNAVLGGK